MRFLLWILLIPGFLPLAFSEGLVREEHATRKAQVQIKGVRNPLRCRNLSQKIIEEAQKKFALLGKKERDRFKVSFHYGVSHETGIVGCYVDFESFSPSFLFAEMKSSRRFPDRGQDCDDIEAYFSKEKWVIHHREIRGFTPTVGPDCQVSGLRLARDPDQS